MLLQKFEKYHLWSYLIFRVFVGFLFLQHGLQKFAIVVKAGAAAAPSAPALFSLMWFAGVIEIVVGIAVLIGLFTRGAALVGALQMIVAYVKVHAPQGINPFLNGGELAVMFFVAFLILLAHGAGKWSLERVILKKEFL